MGPIEGGSFGIRYMETGGCYQGLTQKSCALKREDCSATPGFVYKSALEIINFDDDRCDPNDAPIGRCLDGSGCAPRRTDCQTTSEFEFVKDDASCTIQRDKVKFWDVNNPDFTRFGSCKNDDDEYFCVFDPKDCDSSQQYQSPAQTKAAGVDCDCSEVHVTGCYADGLVYCAIDADACGTGDLSISVQKQRLERSKNPENLDCRLCKKVNTPEPTPSPTKYKHTMFPTGRQLTFAPTLSPTSIRGNNNMSQDSSDNLLIGGIIGGVLAVGLTLGIVYKFACNKNTKEFDTAFDPPKDIMIS